MKSSQAAIQLVGPGELRLNADKPVPTPGPFGVLAQTEAVGLCFSDMKLLKQFDAHPRKSEIIAGIDRSELSEMANYVPDRAPTVPGHEVVCRVVAIGESVSHYRVGQRLIVQADYRPLKTAGSNGAFGYNFEGGLQEYVLLDERVIGDPDEQAGYMIRVPESQSRSQLALVEPWACVENSYATPERRAVKPDGRMLLVAETGEGPSRLAGPEGGAFETVGRKALQGNMEAPAGNHVRLEALAELPDEAYDDIAYYGSNPERIEILNDKLAKGGIINVVLGGKKIGRPVNIGVGRIHYGGTRWVGTAGNDPADGYAMIPQTGELRSGEHALVVGAGGPMGQMHVIRSLALGAQITAADLDLERMKALSQKVGNHASYRPVANADLASERFSYFAIMAPVPALVADAIARAEPGAIVNVFAGIPAPTKHPLDLDAVIERKVFVFGTSGSETSDMRAVLRRVVSGELDTNLSVGAIAGMAGAVDGLRAVEERTMNGKIVVYPQLSNVPLIALEDIESRFPTVAAKLDGGRWTPEAEEELLRVGAA